MGAAVYFGTKFAQKAIENAEVLGEDSPDVSAKYAIPGFHVWSTYNLLFLQDTKTEDVYLCTDTDVDRLIKLCNWLGTL